MIIIVPQKFDVIIDQKRKIKCIIDQKKGAYMSKRHSQLTKAKKNKNDEFFTQIEDIEKELKNYWGG